MSLIICKECGKEIDANSKQCPNCGFVIEEEKETIQEVEQPDLINKTKKIHINKKMVGIIVVIVVIVAIFGIVASKIIPISMDKLQSEEKYEETEKSTVLENDYVKIDGIYVDESFEDDDLSLVYLFYTVNAIDENVELSSVSMKIKFNDKNEYSSTVVKDYIPSYTNYYYSDIIKTIYVGKSYLICSTFEIAKGDLSESKEVTLQNSNITDIDTVKFTTDDIKSMDNLAKISEDLDKSVYETKYNEEQDKLADVDSSTVSKVRNDINGYYFEGYINFGTTLQKCKIEFEAPNKFTVSLYLSTSGNSASISNSGTYDVKKGVITLDYGSGATIFLEYNYDDGDISITNLNEQFGTLVEYDPLDEED